MSQSLCIWICQTIWRTPTPFNNARLYYLTYMRIFSTITWSFSSTVILTTDGRKQCTKFQGDHTKRISKGDSFLKSFATSKLVNYSECSECSGLQTLRHIGQSTVSLLFSFTCGFVIVNRWQSLVFQSFRPRKRAKCAWPKYLLPWLKYSEWIARLQRAPHNFQFFVILSATACLQ